MYAYLLVRAGHELNGGQQLQPGHVEMIYWFANFASQPERFAYDQAAHEADEVYLFSLIETIKELGNEESARTSEETRCACCLYAPLCERGAGPEAADTLFRDDDEYDDDDAGLSFDFEQIAEIEY